MPHLPAARERFWIVGNEMRIKTQATSAHLCRNGIKMVIFGVDRDDYDIMLLEDTMDGDQSRLAWEKAPKLIL